VADLPKVYLFSNGIVTPFGDHMGVAIAEDGEVLASHVCSSPSFFQQDLHGAWRAEVYVKKFGGYGDGEFYRIVQCAPDEVPEEVFKRNAALAESKRSEERSDDKSDLGEETP
jgi:hypothetical protein